MRGPQILRDRLDLLNSRHERPVKRGRPRRWRRRRSGASSQRKGAKQQDGAAYTAGPREKEDGRDHG
jgi:hypothetical protein